MAIEWKRGNRYNDWQEHLLVSMQFSIRHILFILFYICILLAYGKFNGDKRYNEGIKEERQLQETLSKQQYDYIKYRQDKCDEQIKLYLKLIESQRKAYTILFNENRKLKGEQDEYEYIEFCEPVVDVNADKE